MYRRLKLERLLHITFFASILFISGVAMGQYVNILISDKSSPNETSICINTKNTQQMIAGANLNSFYNSSNSGNTWTHTPLTSSTLGVWGDPCLIIDTLGYFYFFHLSNPPSGGWIDRIVCQRSTDNGLTWNSGVGIGLNSTKQQDKEWAAVNLGNNEIYVTWTQFDTYGVADTSKKSNILFSKSTDQGLNWTNPVQINKISGDCQDSDNTVEGAVPAVGPESQIYVSWAGPQGFVFDRSFYGWNTWLDNDINVCDIPGGWDYMVPGIYRCNGLPVTCCDLSNSTHRGNIYINWTDQRNGSTDTDVWFVKSSDEGLTWSAPKRVNNDTPGKQQFFTWMAVDQATGYIWFVFYDRRNYSDTQTDIWMAVSKDGGETFENFKVSESPFVPNASVFFGDYTGVSAHNGYVRPIWTRLDNASLTAWTALINPINTSLMEEEKLPFSIEQNYPNPFTESSTFAFKLRRPATISLSVYNILGHRVAVILYKTQLEPGKYIEQFDPASHGLASGVYYFSLSGGGMSRQSKIVFQR